MSGLGVISHFQVCDITFQLLLVISHPPCDDTCDEKFWKAIITASSHTQFSHPGAQTANLLGKRGWPPTREFDRLAENQLLRKFPLPVHSCPSTPASSHSALPHGVVIPLQPPCQSFRDISANLVLLSSLRILSRPFALEPVRWAPPFVC